MATPKKTERVVSGETRALERARELPNPRTSIDIDMLCRSFADHLQFSQGKDEHTATALDRFFAAAYSVRDRMMRRWIQTQQSYYRTNAKRVYYLSLEFLIGKLMEHNLINLGMLDAMKSALSNLGLELTDLLDQEPDAGLGNGGLGRLAACFLDSMATMSLPAYGYGIRYEFGIFDQEIRDGWQVERPEEWLRFGNAWEIPRPTATATVSRTPKRAPSAPIRSTPTPTATASRMAGRSTGTITSILRQELAAYERSPATHAVLQRERVVERLHQGLRDALRDHDAERAHGLVERIRALAPVDKRLEGVATRASRLVGGSLAATSWRRGFRVGLTVGAALGVGATVVLGLWLGS